MQRFICRFLAAASLLAGWRAGEVFARPRYGGVLRIETHESARSLDPADRSTDETGSVKEKLISLIFERLVRLDNNNIPRPALALSWQHDSRKRRWEFRLRPGVQFHDGSALTAESAARALSASSEAWKIGAGGDSLAIESDQPMPNLLFELARASHSIFLRGADQQVFGTGPFKLAEWTPGRRAVLAANERHWAGRPFLDALAVEMGRPLAGQLTDLELGKADFIEVWPNEMRRLPKETKVWPSSAHVLIVLAFERERPAAEDAGLREALALSIDRTTMHNWLLQKQGTPAAALLPQNISGYAFLFSAQPDLKKARQLVSKHAPLQRPFNLAYDASDPLARSIAERIAVDAREAGLAIHAAAAPRNPDMRLLRLPIGAPAPEPALFTILRRLNLADNISSMDASSIEAIYKAESAALADRRAIPLFHVPEIFGSSPRVKAWMTAGIDSFGEWHFEDMYLEMEKP